MSLQDASIQWHVDADDLPFGTFDTKVGAGAFIARAIGGWLPFADYLDEIATLIGTAGGGAWAASIVASGSEARVRFTKAAGADVGLRWSQSMADLLGFDSTTIAAAGSHLGDKQPAGYVQIEYPEWHDPEPVRDTMLTQYRMGRLVSFPWGKGAVYPVRILITRDEYTRLTEGPCSVGKVRISGLEAFAVSESHPDGYLDGFLEALDPKRVRETDEEWLEVEASLYYDGQVTRAEALADPVWGHLRRGIAVMYSAKIEGIPKIIAERDIGLAWSDHTVFGATATYPDRGLVIDSSGAVGWLADRGKGIVNSDSLTFGILDPQNVTGYWKHPTGVYRIAEDVDVAEAAITVSAQDDLTAVAVPCALYLGKEYLDVQGKDTTVPGAHQFTAITRGTWGYEYEYPVEAISPYCELTNVPRLTTWVGRYVELWASLVDPFGRSVGTTFTDSSSAQVFFGHISGIPAYERGVWKMTAHSAERKLAETKIGGASQALLQGSSSAPEEGAEGKVYLYKPTDATLAIRVWSDSTTDDGTEAILGIKGAASAMIMKVEDFAAWLVESANDAIATNLGSGVITHLGTEKADDGAYRIVLQVDLLSPAGVPTEIAIYPTDASPPWLGSLEKQTGVVSAVVTLPIYRQADWHLIIEEPQTFDLGCDALPSSGYLAIGADDNTEIVHYSAKMALPGFGGNRYLLTVDERQVGGTPAQDWAAIGTVCTEALYPEDSLGTSLLKILHSSGTGARSGTYDVYARGWGYGFDDSHVDAASFGVTFLSDVEKVRPIITKAITLEELYGGLLAAQHYAIGPVRSGNALKIGLIQTRPLNGVSDVEIDDDSILLRQGAKANELWSGPSQIKWTLGKSVLSHGEHEITQRNVAAYDAKGGQEVTIGINGLTPASFYSLVPALGQAILKDTVAAQQLRLQCGGWQDFLPGQNAGVDLTHPDIWDPTVGAPGFAGYGRIYGVQRNLSTGVVTVTVHTGGNSYSPLCPSCQVRAIAGDTLTLTAGETAWFEVGDEVLIYNPGTSDETTVTIVSISDPGLTFGVGGVEAWTTADWTVVTYPDVADCTVRQRAYTHVDDGQTWE